MEEEPEQKIIKYISSQCGISVDEYKKLERAVSGNQNDLTLQGLDISKEMKKSTSNIRLLTGIQELDNLTGGLRAGVNVISGFRKCCKSTFALNLVYRALNDGMNVCLLSLEMTKADVINMLISLHSFELDPKTAITRDEIENCYNNSRDKYNDYLNSFFSLPGNLIIYTEDDIKEYNEANFDEKFNSANKCFIRKNNKITDLLVVDNINCIRLWEKSTGEKAYTNASNYFRKVSLSFGISKQGYDLKPVICLLLCQINRAGGKDAGYLGFYPESCIAETVNIERDATTIIPIYVNPKGDRKEALIKLEVSRYSKPMDNEVSVPMVLKYGKIGPQITKINIDQSKIKLIEESLNYKREYIECGDFRMKIIYPKNKSKEELKKVGIKTLCYENDEEYEIEYELFERRKYEWY